MRAPNLTKAWTSNVPGAACVLLLIGICGLGGCARSPQKSASSRSAAAVPFRVDDVELVGMQLGSADGGKTYRVAGQIKNDSQDSSITEVQLKLVLQDCLESGDCQVISEERPTVQLNVPPGQARDFEVLPVFKGARAPKGQVNWRYEVIAAKGAASGPA